MYSPKKIIGCLLLFAAALPVLSQENHRQEPVTGVLLARSVFAHGYRHGYEEGYHQGNLDINMARQARHKFSDLHSFALRYEPDFGPRDSFLQGFQYGLMAGYADGFGGKEFRAITELSRAAASLEAAGSQAKARGLSFDNGLSVGYEEGFGRKPSRAKDREQSRLRTLACDETAAQQDGAADGRSEYCEGYRRGLILGRTDASVAQGERGLLEASK